MDGQLLAGPNRSNVWKAADLILDSLTTKCADRLPEGKSPTANSGNQREGKGMLICLSVILPVAKDSYMRRTMETNTGERGEKRIGHGKWERRVCTSSAHTDNRQSPIQNPSFKTTQYTNS